MLHEPEKSSLNVPAYDARGNVLAEYGNAAYPVKFAYDAFGQKTQMRTFRALAGAPESPGALDDDAGDLTTWTYDAATGALLSKTDAAGASVNYVYTATGLLASRAWSRGVSTACAYDAWNRLVSTTYSDGTAGVSQAYDALGRLASVTDAAGTKTFAYDAYGSLVSESDAALNASLARGLDAYGREISLTATRGGEPFALFARSWDAATGRLSGCAYGNVEFAYGRLAGTDLLSEIAVMGGYVMTKRVAYAADRDLPVEIAYEKSDASLIAKRTYSHDALGRVSARTQTRGSAAARSDAFGYNARSELTSATLGSDAYAYAFDYIGNRSTATEKDASLSYVTNSLNQYSGIASSGEATFQSLVENPSEENFSPTYDLDGNATLIRTSTGTWQITYNGENRPIRFENAATQAVVECAYDSQGRRFEKKVTVAGTLTLHERYVYDGYLQIAAFDVSTDAEGTESFALKRVIFWDPEEPTATRPLAINVLGDNLYFPTVDLTKNVCELVDFYGDVAATYDYAPFGAVSAGTPSGSAAPDNPFQWSSEVYDDELGLVYYNYRHYSPADGRFLSRDPIEEQGGVNLYAFLGNFVTKKSDYLGNFDCDGMVNKAKNTEAYLKYKKILDKTWTCFPPEISCGCCQGKAEAFFQNTSLFSGVTKGVIKICKNNFKDTWIFQEKINAIVAHEMLHTVQNCFDREEENPCKKSICREIEAYTKHSYPGVSNLNKDERRERVRSSVLASISLFSTCSSEVENGTWGDYFDELYETCSQKTRD
ncbi:RHS repeat domain-containing protein [Candidatus Spyradosoma sp. SGI.093]|uniref:RHS repeat domain-containing protein n=1 Tax=Candidatus Spyradosoma sp. SGI.093 TaxID=3420583 RepID=UPI003CFC1291